LISKSTLSERVAVMPVQLKLAELRAPLAFVLGSGLGPACDGFEADAVVPFEDIPGVGAAGVAGHEGSLVRARIGDRACLFVKGRRHRYEGGTEPVNALVAALREAGVRMLVLTSAAGCLNPAIGVGDIMLLDDVLDLQFNRGSTSRPLASPARSLGRSLRLDRELSRRLRTAAATARVRLPRGVLASLSGPVYETPSEITALKRIGVDAVSMSVVPELQAANAMGMRVAALSQMTNWAAGLSPGPLSHDEVLESGHKSAARLARLIGEFVSGL
jgi:purine-nucleoside phosphorylase